MQGAESLDKLQQYFYGKLKFQPAALRPFQEPDFGFCHNRSVATNLTVFGNTDMLNTINRGVKVYATRDCDYFN